MAARRDDATFRGHYRPAPTSSRGCCQWNSTNATKGPTCGFGCWSMGRRLTKCRVVRPEPHKRYYQISLGRAFATASNSGGGTALPIT